MSHFASMDSYQLLEATQRALGDATLHGQHRRLVTLSGEERVAASVGLQIRTVPGAGECVMQGTRCTKG